MTDSRRWIYVNGEDNRNRYVLGHVGTNPLLCVGVNPSTAEPGMPDATIRSVARIAERNGNDGWIMVNLYPQRATNPRGLDRIPDRALMKRNVEELEGVISRFVITEVWAAWGNLIGIRPYLVECLSMIRPVFGGLEWVRFGNPTKAGNPHHPLYLRASSDKNSFDVDAYIKARV